MIALLTSFVAKPKAPFLASILEIKNCPSEIINCFFVPIFIPCSVSLKKTPPLLILIVTLLYIFSSFILVFVLFLVRNVPILTKGYFSLYENEVSIRY